MSYGQLAMDKCYCCDFKTKSEIKNELTLIWHISVRNETLVNIRWLRFFSYVTSYLLAITEIVYHESVWFNVRVFKIIKGIEF